jgi:hypothetical protein
MAQSDEELTMRNVLIFAMFSSLTACGSAQDAANALNSNNVANSNVVTNSNVATNPNVVVNPNLASNANTANRGCDWNKPCPDPVKQVCNSNTYTCEPAADWVMVKVQFGVTCSNPNNPSTCSGAVATLTDSGPYGSANFSTQYGTTLMTGLIDERINIFLPPTLHGPGTYQDTGVYYRANLNNYSSSVSQRYYGNYAPVVPMTLTLTTADMRFGGKVAGSFKAVFRGGNNNELALAEASFSFSIPE